MSSLDEFYTTLEAQKIKSSDEYRYMFNVPRIGEEEGDNKNYNSCVWDSQGKVICKNWFFDEKNGFLREQRVGGGSGGNGERVVVAAKKFEPVNVSVSRGVGDSVAGTTPAVATVVAKTNEPVNAVGDSSNWRVVVGATSATKNESTAPVPKAASSSSAASAPQEDAPLSVTEKIKQFINLS